MKKKIFKICNFLLFISCISLPFLGYSQSEGPPTPFNDKPVDFEDSLAIDSHVVLFIILGLVIAFYLLVLKKEDTSSDKAQ